MTQHYWFRLYVQRIGTTKKMARFYAMSIEPDLFGGSALVHRWGRIGTRGHERIDLPKDYFQAISHFLFFRSPEARTGVVSGPAFNWRRTRRRPATPLASGTAKRDVTTSFTFYAGI